MKAFKTIIGKLTIGGNNKTMNQSQQKSNAYYFDSNNTAPPEVQRQLIDLLEWHDEVMAKALIVTPAVAKRELPPRPIRRKFPSSARDILLLTTSNSSIDLVGVMLTMMTSERNTAVAVKMAATEDVTVVRTIAIILRLTRDMATVTGNVPEIAMKAMNVQKAISKAKVTVTAAWKIMERRQVKLLSKRQRKRDLEHRMTLYS